jgi:NAD(P)-dependent dehydrogenase (short-subunit alcohol dehydrogenase family)
MSKLQGKVAVITGGNSGIGLATARKFVEEGAYVFITGRRQAELDKAVKLIGKDVTAVQGDVSNPADLDRLYARVEGEKGKIDVVVANAGLVQVVPLTEITDEHYDTVFNVNVRGLLYTVQKALPLFKDGGSIILVGSIAAFKTMPAYSVYCASKAAVRSFARNWTVELKDRKIRVNTLSPGPIDTPITDTQASTKEEVDQIKARFAAAIPMGRMGNSEEVATAAVFLASDDSSFVTGIDLCVDGGLGQI